MDDKFLKPFDPGATESRIYEQWEKSGYFNPDYLPGERKEIFSMVLPPPNVTGTLHLGGALFVTLEDIMTRYARMRGKRALWIPGTDSAAIATQARVEKDIQKTEGKSRYDLGREELLRRIGIFVEQSKSTMLSQMRTLGASLDWSRYAYTMDESRYRAVMEAFLRMYEGGLIYRGNRIVNWDPKGQTTISDDEIVYEEKKEKFYYLKYGPFTIGTSRPETKFGDKYVVMHPDDARYAAYKEGQKIPLEWINGPIIATVVKDTAIDMTFGTGVMTITPWHDATDFDIAERHGLEKEQVIDERGKLLPIAGEFSGMKISEAREKIIEKLRSKNLLEKEEEYVHSVTTAERTGGIIEPQIKLQWFVAVNKPATFPTGETMTLREWMRRAVERKDITFVTERYERVYYNWIDNLRDWCISRQIWFGHRIPVWYRGDEMKVQVESPGSGWIQDDDVLDTWFSSGLWTFSTLGWPDETKDLKAYHPTSVIESGYDILFFWMARMILMSGFLLGQVPFKTIYIHGLVRDAQGRKISKSLGNNVDPVAVAKEYGTDALRMSLIVGNTPGTDFNFDPKKTGGYKKFANKLWNIARFVLEYHEKFSGEAPETGLVTELNTFAADVTQELDTFHYHLAAEKLYHFVWDRFAAEIIEESKPILSKGDAEASKRAATLSVFLTTSLKLLHPFMPFVTEEIWQALPYKDSEMLMIAKWPAP